jgi:hypothetical protein
LINPENASDNLERKSLQLLEKKDVAEASTIEMIGKSFYFRYIAPLYVEQSCLECHRKQGYAVGDIIEAISVSVPMDTTFAIIESSRKFMVIGGFTTLVVLVSSLFLITRHMVIMPINRIRTMMITFSRDDNPDVPILKTNDELEDLSKSFQEMGQSIAGYHTNNS